MKTDFIIVDVFRLSGLNTCEAFLSSQNVTDIGYTCHICGCSAMQCSCRRQRIRGVCCLPAACIFLVVPFSWSDSRMLYSLRFGSVDCGLYSSRDAADGSRNRAGETRSRSVQQTRIEFYTGILSVEDLWPAFWHRSMLVDTYMCKKDGQRDPRERRTRLLNRALLHMSVRIVFVGTRQCVNAICHNFC